MRALAIGFAPPSQPSHTEAFRELACFLIRDAVHCAVHTGDRTMAKFVAEQAVSEAVRTIMSGNDVRCAVAFWGPEGAALASGALGSAPRLVCDVTMGATSSFALRSLARQTTTI